MDKRSIDFSKMEEQFGDERVIPFSFSTDPESVQKAVSYTHLDVYKRQGLYMVILGVICMNGIPEAILAGILTLAITRALLTLKK